MTQEKFLRLLFEPDEQTCFTDVPYGTSVSSRPRAVDTFFSINALRGTRADANITSYRNFLIELDNVPLQEQVALVTGRIPVSAITFSGNKSYHFIISLRESLGGEEAYRRTWRGLYEAVPEADKSTKNPSRLSRLPGVLRKDTGMFQELLYLGTRINVDELPKAKPIKEFTQSPEKLYVTEQVLKVFEIGVDNFIEAKFSGRNQFFYWLGKRCSELGHTKKQKKELVDKIYEQLQNKSRFSKREAYAAARVVF